MKKILILTILFSVFLLSADAKLFLRKEKPTLFLYNHDPRISIGYDNKLTPVNVFRRGERIYFGIYTQKGFKSEYIKYQIVRQDDNAHIGGYSRVMNKTVRIDNNNYYIDYFVINSSGKYFLQIFDIENLHQWIAMGAFAVFDE